MKKSIVFLALLLATALLVAGCAQKAPAPTASPAPTEVPATEAPATEAPATEAPVTTDVPAEPQDATQGIQLTLEELSRFNGKEGQRAYVAVDGIIYDVSDSPAWKSGDHNGFEAGNDLTDAIKNTSPHGIAKLQNVVEVGKLITK